ncbi:MAG: anhydro-N-acetylmuramic acid kinase [Aeromonas sp.]
MANYYIGLMSGTSLDGIDAVLIHSDATHPCRVIAALGMPWPSAVARELSALCLPGENEIDRLGVADNLVAEQFAKATHALLEKAQLESSAICAIGSHGQTIRHRPGLGFTLQIGNPALLAARTGINVVSDFRRPDMAQGGQGAPLVPAFHQALFAQTGQLRVVLNLGGIANISVLPGPEEAVVGFDTGPANTLLDAWYQRQHPLCPRGYDANGAWASRGEVHTVLLAHLLSEPYFSAPYPKSTGREHFTLPWLEAHVAALGLTALAPADIARTLQALTCHSIAQQLPPLASGQRADLFVCGGGRHNAPLLAELASLTPQWQLAATDALGIDADWVEGAAFAWLAMRYCQQLSGNLPAVTGAKRAVVLGGFYPAP